MVDYPIISTTLGGHSETIRQLLLQGERESGNFHVDAIGEGVTALLAFYGPPTRIENVVGVLVFHLTEDEPPAFHARILYVKPDFQNRGIGTSLLEEAAKTAEIIGCTDFAMHVKAKNADMLRLIDRLKLTDRSFRFHLTIVPDSEGPVRGKGRGAV